MKAFRKCRALLLFCTLTGAAFAAAADEAAIRKADAAWSHAAETKDLEKVHFLLRRRCVRVSL